MSNLLKIIILKAIIMSMPLYAGKSDEIPEVILLIFQDFLQKCGR
jgi:hypothetical protein